MKDEYAERIKELIENRYGHLFYVINYPKKYEAGSYLWVHRLSDNEMNIIIHGGEYEPFELKFRRTNEDEPIVKQFDTLKEMEEYIKKDLLDEIMVYEI